MLKFFSYLFCVLAKHRFEQGYVDHFSYLTNPNLILFLSSAPFRQEEHFISFQKQFTQLKYKQIQQQETYLYLNLAKLDFQYLFPQGYTLDITSVSTVGFTVKLVCESPYIYYQVEFNWFAFNDERVKIINNLNITNPQSQYIHSYQTDCNINMAISNFVSFYALGAQFNNLTGLILSSDTVTISFYMENLKQIGYQILLSNSDIFLIGPTITSIQPYGSIQVVNFPSGWKVQNCYLNLLGFKHDGSDTNIRLFTQVTYSSDVTVGIFPWISIILSVQHNYFCINHLFFELAIFKGLIQSRFYDPLNSIDTHIEIQEIGYSQNQNLEEQLIIAKEIESIRIIYYWKCIDKEVLKLTIFCIEEWCSQSNIKCDVNKIHTVRLQAKFVLNQVQEQYLKIAKSSVSLSATQILQNTNPFEQVLFKIELLSLFQRIMINLSQI